MCEIYLSACLNMLALVGTVLAPPPYCPLCPWGPLRQRHTIAKKAFEAVDEELKREEEAKERCEARLQNRLALHIYAMSDTFCQILLSLSLLADSAASLTHLYNRVRSSRCGCHVVSQGSKQ